MQLLARWFWYLLPANPMLVRIVQGGSRRFQHLLVRMGYLGALIALVMIGLLAGQGVGGSVDLSDLAKSGARIFSLVAYGQVILICLIAPLFMAGAIASEQSGKTFDILLTTPMTNLQIVLGSLFGRLFFVWALLAGGLPLFAVLLVFGGVPVKSIFIAFAVAGLTALTVGAVAVTLSVMRTGGRKAVFVFVVAIAAYLVLGYAVDYFLIRRLTSAPGQTTWFTPLHPLLVLESSIHSATYQPPDPQTLGALPGVLRFYLAQPFAAFAALSALVSGLLVIWSALLVRQLGEGSGRIRTLLAKALRRPAPGERRRAPRWVGTNPIAWRESHTRGNMAAAIAARWSFTALAVAAGVGLLLAYHFQKLPALPNPGGAPGTLAPHEVFHLGLTTLLLMELAVVSLVAIYMSAGSVSREREDGSLDILLTTPVTPKQYIWGKLKGLVSFLTTLLAAPIGTVAIVSVYILIGKFFQMKLATVSYPLVSSAGAGTVRGDLLLPEAPILLTLLLVPFVALCCIVGMNWSVKSKTVLGAVVPTMGIIGALALVMGFCGFASAQQLPVVGPIINALSPVTNIVAIVNPWSSISGFSEEPQVGRISLLVGALIAAGVYSLVVYATLLNIVRGFDHTVRRLTGTG